METDTYAVVEFLNEKTVAVVVEKWLEKKSGVSCSYELAVYTIDTFSDRKFLY